MVESRGALKTPLEEEGLLCSILSSLPIVKSLQFRRVCKFWSSVVTSQAFLKAWTGKHRHHVSGGDDEDPAASCCSPWLVMVRKPLKGTLLDHELVAFDSGLRTWISLHELFAISCSDDAFLSCLGGPSLPLVVNYSPAPNWCGYSNFRADGSQTGLICFLCSPQSAYMFKEEQFHAYYVVVLNPLTGSHEILPQPLKHTTRLMSSLFVAISLQVLAHGEYRVFLKTLDSSFPGDLEIYDSISRTWKAGRSCWNIVDVEMGGSEELDKADFLQFNYFTGDILAYNVELDEWSKVSAWLYHNSHGTILIRHRDRVLVASVQFNDEGTCVEGFVVFELYQYLDSSVDGGHVKGVNWIEVARTPCALWEGFYDVDTSRGPQFEVKIIASGSLVCMTAYYYNGVFGYAGKDYVPLVYNLDQDAWYHLPPYKGQHDVVAVCGMRPSLVALAEEKSNL